VGRAEVRTIRELVASRELKESTILAIKDKAYQRVLLLV